MVLTTLQAALVLALLSPGASTSTKYLSPGLTHRKWKHMPAGRLTYIKEKNGQLGWKSDLFHQGTMNLHAFLKLWDSLYPCPRSEANPALTLSNWVGLVKW